LDTDKNSPDSTVSFFGSERLAYAPEMSLAESGMFIPASEELTSESKLLSSESRRSFSPLKMLGFAS
jgi:hypothetical protein